VRQSAVEHNQEETTIVGEMVNYFSGEPLDVTKARSVHNISNNTLAKDLFQMLSKHMRSQVWCMF
jgi:hypothetical protein